MKAKQTLPGFERFWSAHPRPQSEIPCIVAGCGEESFLKGEQVCSRHHHKIRRYGSPFGGAEYRIGDRVRWLQDAWAVDSDECQLWPFPGNVDGYALFALDGITHRANRFACEMFHGPQPEDRPHAAHECGNRLCVNPKHLSWKSAKDNIADKEAHGTKLFGERHAMAKLNEKQVIEIRSLRGTKTRKMIAEQFNVSRAAIDAVLDGKTWSNVA